MIELASTWFLYFVVYSFLGWVCETIYCSIPAHRFVNRGFLNGPVCPVYGVGAVFTIAVLQPFVQDVFLVFIAGLICTSALEYVTSWAMEMLFHYRWWDYSNKFMNIRGRVCLLNSILFGILCVAVIYLIHPSIVRLIEHFSFSMSLIMAGCFAVAFGMDITITVHSVWSLNERLEKLQAIRDEIRTEFKERWRQSELSERLQRLIEENHIIHRRLLHSFPHLRSHHYDEHLLTIKQALSRRGGWRNHKQNDKEEESWDIRKK